MRSFDTNVILRLVIEDDPEQCERAGRAFERAVAEGGAFFSATALIEAVWVLRVACKQDRAAIVGALRRLVDAVGVTVEREALIRRAIGLFAAGTADFSDYVILESSREADALPVLTFDERFARASGVQVVPPT